MKTEFRRDLAQLPFEEKIRKVSELLQLSAKLKTQRVNATNLIPAAGMEPMGSERHRRESPRGRS